MEDSKLKHLKDVAAPSHFGAENRHTVVPSIKPILQEMTSQNKKSKKKQKKSRCGFCKQGSHKTRSCRYFKRKQKEEINNRRSNQDFLVEETNMLKSMVNMCMTKLESLEKTLTKDFELIFQLLKDIQSQKKNEEEIQQRDLHLQLEKERKEKEKQFALLKEQQQQQLKAQKEREEKIRIQEEQERIEDRKQRIWNEMIKCCSWKEILENVMREDEEGETIILNMKEDWEKRIKARHKPRFNKKQHY